MDKKDCVINPKTNRAVKADSKIGKMILGVKTEAKKAQPKKEPVKKVEAKKAQPKKEPVKKVEAKKEPVKKVEAKKEPVKKTALKQDNYIDILVENWTDDYIGILFSQQQNQKTNNIIKKIETLNKKASSVIPSDLLKLDMELKNKLFEKYVKSSNPKVGIDIIDEGMRDIIKYIDEDAKLPKEIDYKYYTTGIKEGNKKLTKNL
jgi:TPP-dependent indolepyruvate ferredoxin oxidoreductase alpha subunit